MVVILKPRLTRSVTASQSALGGFSFIISETARRHHWTGAGCLSLKSFRGGEALYDVGRGRYRVGSNSYLVLNQGQPGFELVFELLPGIFDLFRRLDLGFWGGSGRHYGRWLRDCTGQCDGYVDSVGCVAEGSRKLLKSDVGFQNAGNADLFD